MEDGNSLESKTSQKQRFDQFYIFHKRIITQIIILSIFIIISFLLIYFFLYNSLYQDLIENNILPKNHSWMIWTSLGLGIISVIIILLSPSANESFNEIHKKPTTNTSKFHKFLTELDDLYNNEQYDLVKNKIEIFLNSANQAVSEKNHEFLLDLLEKTNIARIVKINIDKIKDLTNNNEIKQATQEYGNLNGFINHHLHQIPEKILEEFDALFHEF